MLVREDFLDLPMNVVHLWLDSLYIVMAEPDVAADAVMFLQVRRAAPPWPLPVYSSSTCTTERPVSLAAL